MLGLVVWLFTIWCGMHDVYVMVGMVGGMVGMHANDLLMNSSTVSRQTEPNSEKIGCSFESDICFDQTNSCKSTRQCVIWCEFLGNSVIMVL